MGWQRKKEKVMSVRLVMLMTGLLSLCASAAEIGVADAFKVAVASGDTVFPQTVRWKYLQPSCAGKRQFQLRKATVY